MVCSVVECQAAEKMLELNYIDQRSDRVVSDQWTRAPSLRLNATRVRGLPPLLPPPSPPLGPHCRPRSIPTFGLSFGLSSFGMSNFWDSHLWESG